jgi:hypothetical protein
MSLDPRLRKGLVFGALAVTLAAVRWVDGEPELSSAGAAPAPSEAVQLAQAPRERRAERDALPDGSRATPAPVLPDPRTLRRRSEHKVGDAFGARNWEPPPARPTAAQRAAEAAAAAAPPPPPQAPPLPFRYVGMLGEEEEHTTVFLEKQDKGYAVKPGDVIDGTYRVEETGEGRVVFTYLPLEQRQVLMAKSE